MLSERLMNGIRNDVELLKRHGALEHLQMRGPAYLLSEKFLLDVNPELAEEVRANRPEAERFLAGLIGMM